MANTAKEETRRAQSRPGDLDEDDTLNEVGEEHDFAPIDDEERDAADRRRDPLRIPH